MKFERITVVYSCELTPRKEDQRAAWAYEIRINEKPVREESGILPKEIPPGEAVAEYTGIMSALKWLFENGKTASQIRFNGSRLAVINHVNGSWRAKPDERALFRQLGTWRHDFRDLQFTWVPETETVGVRTLARSRLKALASESVQPETA